MNHWKGHQGSFQVDDRQESQDLMDSDASGSSGRGEDPGGEAFADELKEESDEGDYGMGRLSGSERDDVGAEGGSNYPEDLDSDDEIKLGGFSDSDDVDSEFEDWKAFDQEELEVEHSDEDALREFEEMMGDEEYAELWSTRKYSPSPLFKTNIFLYRK